MRMTLKQLAVFVAIAKEGTVTRASETVALTQSAASMALLDLESGLNAPLFDRIGKRLQLNELGRELLPVAIDILNRCQSFESTALGEGQPIDLKIGATMTISDYYIPKILPDFMRNHSNAKLQLKVGNTRQIIESVSNFQIDIGIIEGSCADPQIQTILWQWDELCIAVAPTHPLCQAKVLTPQDFKGESWVLREEGSGTREVFNNAVLPQIEQASIALEIGHNEIIMQIVAEGGEHVCCLSTLATEPLFKSGQLVKLNTPFWQLKRPLYVIVNQQKFAGPSLKKFFEFLKLPVPISPETL